MNWPLLIIDDSDFSKQLLASVQGETESISEEIQKIASYPNIIDIKNDSEALASVIHIALTIGI